MSFEHSAFPGFPVWSVSCPTIPSHSSALIKQTKIPTPSTGIDFVYYKTPYLSLKLQRPLSRRDLVLYFSLEQHHALVLKTTPSTKITQG